MAKQIVLQQPSLLSIDDSSNEKQGKCIKFLFTSYTLSCFSDRLWAFFVILLLQMYGGLQLIAISQLVNNICIVVFASPLGNYLDKKDKLHAIKIALYLNNTFIIICATLYFLVSFFNLDNNSSFYIYMIYGGIVCNAISEVASLAEKNILSKDWLMIITENDAKDLGKKNATLNILDQATCLISPLLIGFLLIYVEYGYMCLLFKIWNVGSCFVEVLLIKRIYKACPGLHTDPATSKQNKTDEEDLYLEEPLNYSYQSLLKIYFSQSTAKVAIALSFLYMTVLAFDGLSIGYAKAQNTSETILGVFRSVSALTGIIGAFFYMKLESKIGASLTSVVGSFFQQLFSYCCLVSLILPSPFHPVQYFEELDWKEWFNQLLSPKQIDISINGTINTSLNSIQNITDLATGDSTFASTMQASVWVYLLSMTASRIGLWMVDLAITQQMQQSANEGERGLIFGLQNSFCSFCSIIKDLLVVILPDIRTFGLLMILSVAFGTCSLIIIVRHAYRLRKYSTKNNT